MVKPDRAFPPPPPRNPAEFMDPNIAELWRNARPVWHRDGLELCGRVVMPKWERPCMGELVRSVLRKTDYETTVLEIGYGMGFGSEVIYGRVAPSNYTIVEINWELCKLARSRMDDRVNIINADWREAYAKLGRFDVIVFDAYKIPDGEGPQLYQEFVPWAGALLKPEGRCATWVLARGIGEKDMGKLHVAQDWIGGYFDNVEIMRSWVMAEHGEKAVEWAVMSGAKTLPN